MPRALYVILIEERSKFRNLLEFARELERRPDHEVRLLVAPHMKSRLFEDQVLEDQAKRERIQLHSHRPKDPRYAVPRASTRLRGLWLMGRLLFSRPASSLRGEAGRAPLALFVFRLLLAALRDFVHSPRDSFNAAIAFARELRAVLGKFYYCCCLHLDWSPSCVIFQHEGVRTIGRIWTRIATLEPVKTCMITSAYPVPRKQVRLLSTNRESEIGTFVGRLVTERFPHWRVDCGDTPRTTAPIPEVLAAEVAGLALDRPFVPNTGIADLVIVDSPFMAKQLAALNCDQHVVAVGSLGDDRLYRSQQSVSESLRKIRERYDLQRGRRLLVASLPKNYFHWNPIAEFESYEDLVDFWCQRFNDLGSFDVLLSPHPHMKAAGIEVLERYPRLRIAEEWIVDLVPACDLFVAPMSTTMKWARQCGKPVLNYDCYSFADFEGPGVLSVHSKAEFEAALVRCDDPRAFEDLSREAAAPDPQWPALDGMALERIVRVMADRLELPGAGSERC